MSPAWRDSYRFREIDKKNRTRREMGSLGIINHFICMISDSKYLRGIITSVAHEERPLSICFTTHMIHA